jgi:hypothetical protein
MAMSVTRNGLRPAHRSSTLWSRFRRFSERASFQIKDLRAFGGIVLERTIASRIVIAEATPDALVRG